MGFYDSEEDLVAILDLIAGYPDRESAFIGWFMVDAERQNQGIGSQLFADLRASLSAQGIRKLSLACVKENTEARSFWEHQGFTATGREVDQKEFHLLVSANVNAVFQAVEHDFNREEALRYADTLDRFFSRGWQEFFGY